MASEADSAKSEPAKQPETPKAPPPDKSWLKTGAIREERPPGREFRNRSGSRDD